MNKRLELRQKVWLKYNKHCGYCGRLLEYKDMQIDHIEPLAFSEHWNKDSKVHSFNNLMPSCRRCNHYKRAETLEGFRRLMLTLCDRIKGQYISKVAIDYGIIVIKPFDGLFYFERGNRG